VVADGIVYTVGLNGGVAAYGLMNGQRFWKTPINSSQMPWVAGYQLFVLTDKGELACLNRRTARSTRRPRTLCSSCWRGSTT
jgi:hypothetical protein